MTSGRAVASGRRGFTDQIEHRLQRQMQTAREILHRAQHQRAAKSVDLRAQRTGVEPVRGHDVGIERPRVRLFRQVAPEIDAQDGAVAHWGGTPQVQRHHPARLEAIAGFLQSLPDDGLDQAFTGLQVAGGLIEHGVVAPLFFDQQKPVLTLGDGGDGDVRFPDGEGIVGRVRHGQILTAMPRWRR